jgi:hypothetical protein
MATKVDIESFDKPKAYKAGLNKGTTAVACAIFA